MSLADLASACAAALRNYPDAHIIRVRAPESVVRAARADLGLPSRLPAGDAIPGAGDLPVVRVDQTITDVEVDLAVTWRRPAAVVV